VALNLVAQQNEYSLLTSMHTAQFTHKAVTAPELRASEDFTPLVVEKYSYNKNFISSIKVVEGGQSEYITSSLGLGSMGALFKVRDVQIPEMLRKVDALTSEIVQMANSAHNKYTSIHGTQALTGTKSLRLDDTIAASGAIRVAAVDSNGRALKGGGKDLMPLELDLASLDLGSGKTNVKTVMHAINSYFSNGSQRVSIGGLSDIRLVTQASATSGTVALGFTASNGLRSQGVGFDVTSITVRDKDNNVVAPDAVGLSNAHTIAPDAQQQKIPNVGFTFLPQSAQYPYSVSVEVSVAPPNGPNVTSTITYIVTSEDAEIGSRIAASSATGAATGSCR
jgi:hypothetical protein